MPSTVGHPDRRLGHRLGAYHSLVIIAWMIYSVLVVFFWHGD